jgi:MFS family permease
VIEGIGFGGFVTTGQAFVAEHSSGESRGTAIGIYRASSGVGNTVSPLVLGVVASTWGLNAVFQLTSAMLLVGVAVFAMVIYRHYRAAPMHDLSSTTIE